MPCKLILRTQRSAEKLIQNHSTWYLGHCSSDKKRRKVNPKSQHVAPWPLLKRLPILKCPESVPALGPITGRRPKHGNFRPSKNHASRAPKLIKNNIEVFICIPDVKIPTEAYLGLPLRAQFRFSITVCRPEYNTVAGSEIDLGFSRHQYTPGVLP
eukprot:5709426-Pleurochrysis_carterae.AAC.3